MKLVCFTGIDGAGKTTLARNTVTALREQGETAIYVYGRIVPMISRLAMAVGRTLLLRKHNQWHEYGAYTADKKLTLRHPIFAWGHTATILIDYYLQIWLKLLPHLLGRHTVVVDRYIYDTIISDLAAHLGYSLAKAEKAIHTALKLLPRPSLVILLDLPEEVAFSRKTDVPHVDYLGERRPYYLHLTTHPEIELFNGEMSQEELLQATLRKLAEHHIGVVTQ